MSQNHSIYAHRETKDLTYAIETVRLTKKYPQHRGYSEIICHPFRNKEIIALKDINFRIKPGELFCLIGANGAGKTTLIKILCSLILPTSGRAFINDLDVVKCGAEVRRQIGYVVSDERSFYWRLSGRQNLQFFATLYKLASSVISIKIKELLELTGLERDADKMFKDYSAGMKQKMAIARGLLNDPKILFMDEPTRSLDPYASKMLRKFVKGKIVGENRKTVFLTTHNLQEAEILSDKIAIIHNGRFLVFGTMSEILKNGKIQSTFIVSLSHPSKELLDRLIELPHSIKMISNPDMLSANGSPFNLEISVSEKDVPHCIRRIVEHGGDILACFPKRIALEDAFTHYIKESQ